LIIFFDETVEIEYMVENNCNLSSPEIQLQFNLKNSKRQLECGMSWSAKNQWNWKIVEENWSLRSPEVQLSIELEIGRTQLQSVKPEVQQHLNLKAWAFWWILPIEKNSQRSKKMLQRDMNWKKKKHEMQTQAQTVLTLGLDQITKFKYRLDGPLGEGNV
jgi:hypothetical protein